MGQGTNNLFALTRGFELNSYQKSLAQKELDELVTERNELLEALKRLIDNGYQCPSNVDMNYAKQVFEKSTK